MSAKVESTVGGLAGFLQKLQNIQIGGSSKGKVKLKKKDLIYIFRNIGTLIENGLPLPKALETLVAEKSLSKYAPMLSAIRAKVAGGDSFSSGLSLFKDVFGELMIQMIKIGERSGTLPQTIERLTHQLEHADNLKAQVIKKLTYPALLVTAGSGAVTFMLLFVVPTFEKTYKESGQKLPAVTQFLIDAGAFGTTYGWMIALGMIASLFAFFAARRNPVIKEKMDGWFLRMPIFGDVMKNMAVLQFMEVLGNLMEAGFTMADALQSCARAIKNSAVRRSVEQLHQAVLRGERFSTELERQNDLFPPIVKQLTIIGEKTGTLSKCTGFIRNHLKREVERSLGAMIGFIEPVTTLGLAGAIGTILLAIYLPMFDMIGAMGGGH